MRNPGDLPRPRRPKRERPPREGASNRGRVVLIVVVAVLVVLFLSARGIAGFYTDYLWFDSLHFSSVFTGVLAAKVALAVIFTTIFAVLLFANLLIADKLAPTYREPGPEAEFLERYRQLVGRRTGLVRVAVALLFGVIAGVGTSGQWNDWILFTHRVDFGIKDAQFHKDVGFYVFQLPFISFVIGWLFAAFVIMFVVTAVAHYLNGGIRLQVQSNRVTPHVKAHLSVLLGLMALVRAAGYWFDRYELTLSGRGAVTGATYTDVKAQLPATELLVAISLASFVLLIVNIRRRGWVLPVLAVGLWGVVAVAAGEIYPAAVQRFVVQPSENKKETPYIDRNITATRSALGLDAVTTEAFNYTQNVSASDLTTAKPTLDNVQLLEPGQMTDTFDSLQTQLGYYKFRSLDTDRYDINGQPTSVVIGVRDLVASEAPQKSWLGTHLTYTHGSGVALAPVSQLTAEGRPQFLPTTSGDIALTQRDVYFGESLTDYAVVGTKTDEISLNDSGVEQPSHYSGSGGVALSSFLRKAAFALRFNETNLLLSGQITSQSKVLFVRNVHDRVSKLAPFLSFDSDPYPVVTDGHLVWIIDGYTTSSRYPYGQRADVTEVSNASGLASRFNYVRNSVKAVVDAYTGEVTFYVTDNTDPLIRAYEKAFPDLFTAGDQIPPDLSAHFRYPTDLFRVQTNMLGRYHVTDPDTFYKKNEAWLPSRNPGTAPTAAITTGTTVASTQQETRQGRVDPNLALVQLPGSTALQFAQMRTYVPFSDNDQNQKLISFVAGTVDNTGKPTFRVFRLPSGQLPDGPALVDNSIRASAAVSPLQTQFGQQGSSVNYGEVTLVPIGQSILYVRPFYVKADGTRTVREVKKVIVSYNSKTFVADTLDAALVQAFGSNGGSSTVGTGGTGSTGTGSTGTGSTGTGSTGTGSTGTGSTGTGSTGSATVDQLLKDASALYDQAQKLPASSLAQYQQLIDQAFAKVQQAAALVGQSGGSTGSATTTTTSPSSGSTTTSAATSTTVAATPTTTKSSTTVTVKA